MEINQILLTTDFSDYSRGAYGCAADLASKFHAKLHLVHFGGATPFAGAIPRIADTIAREPLFDSLENALAAEASKHPAFDGIDISPRLQRHRWTRSRQRALEQELGIDLIVMSPQGRTGLAKKLLGSFADRVVRHSSLPVLLFRPTEGAETLDPRTVLVLHDFYDRPRSILPAMRWLASQFSCEFRLLHVVEPSWANSQSVRAFELQFAQSLKDTQSLSIEERFAKLLDEDLQGLNANLETAKAFHRSKSYSELERYLRTLSCLENAKGLAVSRGKLSLMRNAVS